MKENYKSVSVFIVLSALSTLFATRSPAITIDGSLDAGYGSALSVQTINTGFGDSNYGGSNVNGADANGSELDAAYGTIQGGNLYLFIAGNSEGNGNHLNVFIDAGQPGGQNTLSITGSNWFPYAMNGSKFSPGFNANMLIEANDYLGTLFLDQYLLQAGGSSNTALGSFGLSAGIGSGILGSITAGLNNSNVGGVNGNSGTAANPAAAAAVTTGWEFEVPLSLLGNPSQVKVLAIQNGFNDGYISNQLLPGLPVGSANIGAGGPYSGASTSFFDLSSLPNEYFTVVPEPSTVSLVFVGVLGAIGVITRRK